jgi:predicted amidohydrolase
MKKTLKICGVQTDILWNAKEDNFRRYDIFLRNLKDCDIVIFPEMFDTGFVLDKDLVSAFDFEITLRWMQQKAAEYNVVLCGSTIVHDDSRYKNRFYFVRPDMTYDFYDKRHLFSMSSEDSLISRGNEREIMNYEEWKIFPQICYDLRFPVWSRNDLHYDLLIYVANWPEARIEQWKKLLLARAIENQSYVVAINRVGKDGNNFKYSGNSLVIDFKGDILYEAKENEQDFFEIELDLEKLHLARKKFNVLIDMDKFLINK